MHFCDKLTTGLFKTHAGGGCGVSFRGVAIMKSMPLGIAAAVAFFGPAAGQCCCNGTRWVSVLGSDYVPRSRRWHL